MRSIGRLVGQHDARHRDREGPKDAATVILDVTREVKPPFNPEAVTLEFADLMRRYRVSQVHGDRYGGQWVADSFRRAGIYYAPSEQVKSEIYLNLLPLVNARACSLLDDDRLVRQLTLERRVSRRGAGAAWLAAGISRPLGRGSRLQPAPRSRGHRSPGWYYDTSTIHLFLEGRYREMLASASTPPPGTTGVALLSIGALRTNRQRKRR